MNTRLRLLVYASALVLLLAGCASKDDFRPSPAVALPPPIADNSGYLNTVLPAWIGHRASELITSWGKPTEASEATPGSYQGRGGIIFSYFIGDKGSGVTIPEISAYTDSLGTHVYDTSTVILPHFVRITFVADTKGNIISANWWGSYTDRFLPANYPMPTTPATLEFPVVANYPSSRHGGNWSEPTAREVAQKAQEVTPDNILDKLNQR